jgi:flagellar basal-body rod protein FlgC
MSGIFGILEVSGSGLSSQRKKLNAVADNIANVETTRTPEGGPYRRKQVVFTEDDASGTFTSSLNSALMDISRTDIRHLDNPSIRSSIQNDVPGVDADEVDIEPESFKMVYDPTHPDADKDGYVAMPDINIIAEMVDMMTSTRAYEANISVAASAKTMYKQALEI